MKGNFIKQATKHLLKKKKYLLNHYACLTNAIVKILYPKNVH